MCYIEYCPFWLQVCRSGRVSRSLILCIRRSNVERCCIDQMVFERTQISQIGLYPLFWGCSQCGLDSGDWFVLDQFYRTPCNRKGCW